MGMLDFLFGEDEEEKKRRALASAQADKPLPKNADGTVTKFRVGPQPEMGSAARRAATSTAVLQKNTPKYKNLTLRAPVKGEVKPVSDIDAKMMRSHADIDMDVENEILFRRSKDQLRGTIPEEVRSAGSRDEIVEAILADASTRAAGRYAKKDEYPDVPAPLRELVNQTGQYVEGGAAEAGDLVQGTLGLLGLEGKLTEPATDQQIFGRYRRFLQEVAPERLVELESNLALEGYSPIAQTAGGVTENLAEGFAAGSVITRSARALPVVQQLRQSGRGGIYAANVLENLAVGVGVNVEYGATRGRSADEIARSIAENPSMLLPLSSKKVIAVGAFSDYMASIAMGRTKSEALANAMLNAGGNIAQRKGLDDDLNISKLKDSFLARFKGNKQLADAAWNESSAIHAYALQNPQDFKGIGKMQANAEKRLLKLHTDFQKASAGGTGERRTVGNKAQGAAPEPTPKRNSETLRQEISQLEEKLAMEGVKIEGAPDMRNFQNRRTGELAEVTGEGGQFARTGDDMATERGFEDSEGLRAEHDRTEGVRGKMRDLQQSIANRKVELRDMEKTELKEQSLKALITDPKDATASFDAHRRLSEQVMPAKPRKVSEVAKGKTDTRKAVRSALDTEEPPAAPIYREEMEPVLARSDNLKDLNSIEAEGRDFYRNIEDVFGKNSAEAKRILEPFDQAKGDFVDMQARYVADLNKNVVQKYRIKKGSKESAAIQNYGEAGDKKTAYAKLVKQFGEKRAAELADAERWFRKSYDELLESVNATRAKIYPNNPEKIIQRRGDYFRHFRDINDQLGGFVRLFESPAGIDTSLAGLSTDTKPKSKFLSFAQRRLGGKTEVDAVGGFIDYVPRAAYATHIDPQIARMRALEESLREKHTGSTQLTRFTEYIHDFANDLSGKTSAYDRAAQKVVGRRAIAAVDWLNKRAKANAVVGNLSSTVAQIFNVPQGIASAGPRNSLYGAARSLADIVTTNKAQEGSIFLKERFKGRSMYDQFDTGMLKNAKKFAAWMTGVLDEVGTKFIWNSHFAEAKAKGMKKPAMYADNITRKLVAGRGIGEVPLIHKSKIVQIAAPFQLEVGNLWWVMGDMAKQPGGMRKVKQLSTLFVASYVMNRVADKIRGSPVVFDPIQAGVDIYNDDDTSKPTGERVVKGVGRMAGEFFSNIPFGQTVAAAAFTKEQREEFFGRADPTRFGSPLVVGRTISNPLFRLLPPFGGAQAEKTLKGAKLIREGGQTSDSGKTQVYASPDNLVGNIQALLFGPSSTSEAQEFFDGGARGYYRKIPQKQKPERGTTKQNRSKKKRSAKPARPK